MKNFLLSNYVRLSLGMDKLRTRKSRGLGTVEVVLITFVLVSLVIMFRGAIVGVVAKYLRQIDPNFSRS